MSHPFLMAELWPSRKGAGHVCIDTHMQLVHPRAWITHTKLILQRFPPNPTVPPACWFSRVWGVQKGGTRWTGDLLRCCFSLVMLR